MFRVSDVRGHLVGYNWRKVGESREIPPIGRGHRYRWRREQPSKNLPRPRPLPRPTRPKEEKRKREEPKREVLRAAQIMSFPVVTLYSDETLERAWEIFQEHRFRHILVISRDGKLVGILSDRDMLRCDKDRKTTEVEEIMAINILSAARDTSVREIARAMFRERIGCMPIVDREGNVVGILTRSDVLRAIMNVSTLEFWI